MRSEYCTIGTVQKKDNCILINVGSVNYSPDCLRRSTAVPHVAPETISYEEGGLRRKLTHFVISSLSAASPERVQHSTCSTFCPVFFFFFFMGEVHTSIQHRRMLSERQFIICISAICFYSVCSARQVVHHTACCSQCFFS